MNPSDLEKLVAALVIGALIIVLGVVIAPMVMR